MGRKRTMNRMAMRGEFDEEEEKKEDDDDSGDDDDDDDDDEGDDEDEGADGEEEEGAAADDDEDGEAKPKKKAPKKKPVKAPAKPRARASKHVRMKVVWGVFNNSNQQLDSFPFPQKDEADAKAARLTAEKKTTHYVQPVKVKLEEESKGK